jgi:hypothetical protein
MPEPEVKIKTKALALGFVVETWSFSIKIKVPKQCWHLLLRKCCEKCIFLIKMVHSDKMCIVFRSDDFLKHFYCNVQTENLRFTSDGV